MPNPFLAEIEQTKTEAWLLGLTLEEYKKLAASIKPRVEESLILAEAALASGVLAARSGRITPAVVGTIASLILLIADLKLLLGKLNTIIADPPQPWSAWLSTLTDPTGHELAGRRGLDSAIGNPDTPLSLVLCLVFARQATEAASRLLDAVERAAGAADHRVFQARLAEAWVHAFRLILLIPEITRALSDVWMASGQPTRLASSHFDAAQDFGPVGNVSVSSNA